MDLNKKALRTDEWVQRIEYALKMTFTKDQFAKVGSYLRLYRQQALEALIARMKGRDESDR